MSWYSKVAWSEGLFLRPHHLQQGDRYLEHLLEGRTGQITPYPWGFSEIEIDRDLAQQSKFGLRRAAGVLSDGTPFRFPGDCPPPPPATVPENAAGLFVWLCMPMAQPNNREVDELESESGSRYVVQSETLIDASSALQIEEEIDIAVPRFSYEIRRTPKPGFVSMLCARIIEVNDKTIVFDERFAPPVLVVAAHAAVTGWLDRVIGWVETKLDELARFASDPRSSGGMQSVDYFVLQMLNREIPALRHMRRSKYTHPERLYVELLRLAGELATYSTRERRANDYPAYDHDNPGATFAPVLADIQRFLSVDISRAIRLEIVEKATNAFLATVTDRNLFRASTFVLEVAAQRSLTELQTQFPALFKVGPNTRMNEIVHAHLPGIGLIHLPTPPAQIRAITSHVYFALDRMSPLWPEFSTASGIGMHFSGDWPGLELNLWVVKEDVK
ncbi:type VI secretion system baseplate subunit TssK [Labrys sp. KNU-23]|uniref:type VI secretion system baseplate subunit TssK n=1 Tax=Labrys sp. KNU-23 TaxID=2789216 RepID=UPI0011EF241C|nr:type VI secretion system baseplate subunit TssK [Labrys sp. KNU-23]QEN85231.1 type VI secretion system baseplate subunit TssK [Labrys sp. KNU-23]